MAAAAAWGGIIAPMNACSTAAPCKVRRPAAYCWAVRSIACSSEECWEGVMAAWTAGALVSANADGASASEPAMIAGARTERTPLRTEMRMTKHFPFTVGDVLPTLGHRRRNDPW